MSEAKDTTTRQLFTALLNSTIHLYNCNVRIRSLIQ